MLTWVSREAALLLERRWHHCPVCFAGPESYLSLASTTLSISPLSLSLAESGRPDLANATIPSPMLTYYLMVARQTRNNINSWVRGEMRDNTIVFQELATNNPGFRSCCITLPLFLLLEVEESWRWTPRPSLTLFCITTFQHLEQRLPSGTPLAAFSLQMYFVHVMFFNLKN